MMFLKEGEGVEEGGGEEEVCKFVLSYCKCVFNYLYAYVRYLHEFLYYHFYYCLSLILH
jgi:hypothetical protein